MLPGAEIAREIGASKLEPTISEDIQEGKVSDAILKGIGTASDVALAGSPFLGPAGLVVGPAVVKLVNCCVVERFGNSHVWCGGGGGIGDPGALGPVSCAQGTHGVYPVASPCYII